MRFSNLVAAFAGLAVFVAAQEALPRCVSECFNSSHQIPAQCPVGASICFCSNQALQSDVTACLVSSCNDADIAVGVEYGVRFCKDAGVPITAAPTPTYTISSVSPQVTITATATCTNSLVPTNSAGVWTCRPGPPTSSPTPSATARSSAGHLSVEGSVLALVAAVAVAL